MALEGYALEIVKMLNPETSTKLACSATIFVMQRLCRGYTGVCIDQYYSNKTENCLCPHRAKGGLWLLS